MKEPPSYQDVQQSFDRWSVVSDSVGIGSTTRAVRGIGFRARQAQEAEFIHLTSQEKAHLQGYWRSPVYRDVVWDTLSASLDPKPLSIHPEFSAEYQRALQLVSDWLATMPRLRPFAPRRVTEILPTTTSPGLPYSELGYRSKIDARSIALRVHRQLVTRLVRGEKVSFPPAFIASRSQVTTTDKFKARPVWVIPLNQVLFEGLFTGPLFEQIRDDPFFGWTYDWLSGGILRFRNMFNSNHNQLFGTDFSKYDQTIPAFLISDTLDVIKEHFELDFKHSLIWDTMKEALIYTPFVFFSRLGKSNGSMPSGSAWTQILECIMDLVIFSTITLKRLDPLSPPLNLQQLLRRSTFLGDDSVFDVHPWYQPPIGKVREESICEDISTAFGLTVNRDKSWSYRNGDAIVFLGKRFDGITMHHDLGSGIHALAYPEYADETPSDLMTRCIGVAYASCGNEELYGICYRNFCYYSQLGYEPTPFKVDYRRFFMHELFMEVPSLKFPTRQEILDLMNKDLRNVGLSRILARRSVCGSPD